VTTTPQTVPKAAIVAVLGLATVALAIACGKNEEPAGSRPARAATVDVASAPAQSARTEPTTARTEPRRSPPSCMVPTPDAPPPKAPRATSCPNDPTGNLDLARGKITFVDAPGEPKVDVELARTGPERERGLMYRTGMPEDDGMLFSWPEENVRTFWMHNTCMPLDMLFVAMDGTIVGILEQVPTLNDDPRNVPCMAAHVLELNAGWTRAHGVKAGQRLRIEH
jgi:uncharacterized membrane protein (UPF0127 family)